jgi:glycosyltransferase involved in cell wall biosynthesis
MAQARVMLSPSLSDGIPNTLYEAMAAGSFPILSPLETIEAVVAKETNVLFARNLYPQEIADALIRAMNDDQLVDRAYAENLKLVKRLADRKRIGEKLVNFYLEVAEFTESHRVPSNRK